MFSMKQIFSKIWINFKIGWNMPTLPEHVSNLDRTNIYVKILKITGPLCIFIFIMPAGRGLIKQFNDIVYYVIFVVSLLYILYRNIIGIYAIKQWIHYIVNKDLVVKNSPIDMSATVIRYTVSGLKVSGRFTVGTGFTYVLCRELDDILEKEGKNPYFVPEMKKLLKASRIEDVTHLLIVIFGIEDQVSLTSDSKLTILNKLKNFSSPLRG